MGRALLKAFSLAGLWAGSTYATTLIVQDSSTNFGAPGEVFDNPLGTTALLILGPFGTLLAFIRWVDYLPTWRKFTS
jgi:hypothetical protein